jgi:hypothetical protein
MFEFDLVIGSLGIFRLSHQAPAVFWPENALTEFYLNSSLEAKKTRSFQGNWLRSQIVQIATIHNRHYE